MASKSLVHLPVELVCLILTHLDVSDLLNCSVLSRHFRTIVNNSSRMLYAIELEKYKLVCVTPPSQHPSYARRLQILQDREHAWTHMRWKGRHKLKLPFSGSVYDFTGGIYGNGGDESEGMTASISFLKLPSADEEIHHDQIPKPRLWTHLMADILIFDFTMDPSQDLLVLLALAPPLSKSVYELHLRTLSTNEPHPQALSSKIPCIPGPRQDLPPSDLNPAVTIQVVGDLVAVLFKELVMEHSAHLEIWNWKLGPKYSSAMHRIAGIDDFTFLNEESFLLVRPSERLEVYKFAPPTNRSSVPQCVVSLELPPLSSQYRYWYITMSSNPIPGYVPHFPSSSSIRSDSNPRNINVKCSSSEQLYYPNLQERVLACCLYIFDVTQPQDNSVRSFVFFVNIDTFLKPVEHWLSIMPERFFTSTLNQGIYRYTLLDLENGELSFAADHNEPLDVHGQGLGTHYTASDDDQPINGIHTSDLVDVHTKEPESMSSSIYSTSSSPPITSSSSHQGYLLYAGAPLMAAGNSHRRWHLPPGSYPSIPWEVWGPKSTRWFNGNWRTDWQHATYGLRTVDTVRVRQNDTARGKGKTKAMPFKAEVIDGSVTGLWQGVDESDYESESSSEEELDEEIDNFGGEDEVDMFNDGPGPLRILRVRDYNPYSVALASERLRSGVVKEDAEADSSILKNGKGKGKALEHTRVRVVTGPSITPVHGVFKEDIKSSLPYVEVMSKEKFDVTDVMLDDRRLLLLKRGSRGLLISIDVLMM